MEKRKKMGKTRALKRRVKSGRTQGRVLKSHNRKKAKLRERPKRENQRKNERPELAFTSIVPRPSSSTETQNTEPQ